MFLLREPLSKSSAVRRSTCSRSVARRRIWFPAQWEETCRATGAERQGRTRKRCRSQRGVQCSRYIHLRAERRRSCCRPSRNASPMMMCDARGDTSSTNVVESILQAPPARSRSSDAAHMRQVSKVLKSFAVLRNRTATFDGGAPHSQLDDGVGRHHHSPKRHRLRHDGSRLQRWHLVRDGLRRGGNDRATIIS